MSNKHRHQSYIAFGKERGGLWEQDKGMGSIQLSFNCERDSCEDCKKQDSCALEVYTLLLKVLSKLPQRSNNIGVYPNYNR